MALIWEFLWKTGYLYSFVFWKFPFVYFLWLQKNLLYFSSLKNAVRYLLYMRTKVLYAVSFLYCTFCISYYASTWTHFFIHSYQSNYCPNTNFEPIFLCILTFWWLLKGKKAEIVVDERSIKFADNFFSKLLAFSFVDFIYFLFLWNSFVIIFTLKLI